MSRRTAGRLGKMPTTSVLRRVSLFRRSWELFYHTCFQRAPGKEVNARMSAPAPAPAPASIVAVREEAEIHGGKALWKPLSHPHVQRPNRHLRTTWFVTLRAVAVDSKTDRRMVC